MRTSGRPCRRNWLAAAAIGTALLSCIAIPGCKRDGEKASGPPGTFTVDDPALVERNNRGVALMGRYEYADAAKVFTDLVAEHPGWHDVKVNAAIATLNRQQEGDEETAARLLREVIEQDPGQVRATYTLGLLLNRAGQAAEALALFRAVAEADPDDAYAAYFVGQCSENDDPEGALGWYQRALEKDPYLRSASYRAFQILQRLGRQDEAQRRLDDFQRLEGNPRARIVEVVYTKMGPKAEVLAIDLDEPAKAEMPTGPILSAPRPLLDADLTWIGPGEGAPSITACDIDADGRLDLFAADALREPDGAVNAVLLGEPGGGFAADRDHALARVPGVNAVLWGDWDNDGDTDAYLCRRGPNQMWRHDGTGTWEDVTAATGTAGGDLDTVDGIMVDADHDGDLDVFCANADGPNELFNNDLDGTFRAIAAAQGIDGGGRQARQAIAADLDGDRDLDLVVINAEPPHEAYRNDRLWRYEPATGLGDLLAAPIGAAVAADLDADGRVEIVTRAGGGAPVIWRRDGDGAWRRTPESGGADEVPGAGNDLAVSDLVGGGERSVIWRSSSGWALLGAGRLVRLPEIERPIGALAAWTLVTIDPSRGPAIAGLSQDRSPLLWAPGPGRHPFAALSLTGRTDGAQSMRSNASGIGARAAVRVGSRWSVVDVLDESSGPGQSLQPLAVGLGGAPRIDFVAIDWSDGVFQSEMDLDAGRLHLVPETQRQVSSCPVLFTWNGEEFEFVSDLLGVGGIGFLLAPGEYSAPRPKERFLLPAGVLAPRDGRLAMKITEPMQEACYLDAARLLTVDLPAGWQVVPDERMRVGGPEPTGALLYYREEMLPRRVVNDRERDVTALAGADGAAAPAGDLDPRFIGRLARDHALTLEFPAPIDPEIGAPTLVIDGWIEYPYSQTMFAAWQAGAAYRAPTLEAKGSDGVWRVVLEQFGYPAGMPRRMALPLPELPAGTRELRLTTNQEIYWDRIAVAYAEPCPEARTADSRPIAARVERPGFPERTTGDQRRPHYDFGRRKPFWDTRHMAGLYTRLGPGLELVAEADDAVAVFGPGEGVHLEFAAAGEPPPHGWTRRYVLEAVGWCKDMDLYTRDGETVGPLPLSGAGSPRRDDLHERYNTRYASGR